MAPINAHHSTEQLPTETDVLIVGYGPVGAAMAALLGKYGVRTIVIDRAANILNIPRAVGMDNEGLRIIQMAGLSDTDFEKISVNKTRMVSSFMGEYAQFNMTGVINGHAKQVMYFQPDLEKALRKTVKSHTSVQTFTEVELISLSQKNQSVNVMVDSAKYGKQQITAKYVIGADGAGSRVRKQLGIEFEGRSYAENWLIVDAKNLPNMNHHIDFFCGSSRPGPHLPGAGNRQRWEFMLKPEDNPKEMEKPEKIRELLSKWGDTDQMEIERKAVYQFHARVCSKFHQGRVFLVGDAAHVTPPFLGQGLVAGLRDAANLSWKLTWVLKGLADENILQSYDQERRPHAIHMIRLARMLGAFIRPKQDWQAKLAHGTIRMLRLLPPIKDYIDEAKLKPEHHFKTGLFKNRAKTKLAAHTSFKPGTLMPQGMVRNQSNEILLSDEALGTSMCLVGFGEDPANFIENEEIKRWKSLGGNIIQFSMRSQNTARTEHSSSSQIYEDLTGLLVPNAKSFGTAAIVRPDRTVLVEGTVSNAGELIKIAINLLNPPTRKRHLSHNQQIQAG